MTLSGRRVQQDLPVIQATEVLEANLVSMDLKVTDVSITTSQRI